MKMLISIIVPVYNEETNIPSLLERLSALHKTLEKQYDMEFVFTDNCSTDRTFELLAEHGLKDKRIRVFRFSRNFGFQRSILTGFLRARGDVAIQLDADLQDPPELIPDFLEQWENGYDVVYGIRKKRQEGRLITFTRKVYYKLLNAISDYPVAADAGDFRLISRRVIEVLRSMQSEIPYIRGTISEIGFPQVGIPYDRDARTSGESKFRLFKLIGFALDGFIHQSSLPLRLSAYFGMGTAGVGAIFLIRYIYKFFTSGPDWPAGFATLTFLMVFTIISNAIFFAIIGEYLGRIYKRGKGLPITIIDQTIDHHDSDDRGFPIERSKIFAPMPKNKVVTKPAD